MSFVDWPVESRLTFSRTDARRKRIAARLIQLFERAFPSINYSLVWESRLINAQAWRLGESRNVFLYGGLARHAAIGKAGLALALAHETGHHLGGPPRDPIMTWMTWQGQADYWAAKIGMPAVFGPAAGSLTLRGALQIAELEGDLGDQSKEWTGELATEKRLEIFRAGVSGEIMPVCTPDYSASF